MTQLSIPARHYAVFTHRDHISAIRNTMRAIWSEWLPRSGHRDRRSRRRSNATVREFDTRTGNGGLEVWLPIKL